MHNNPLRFAWRSILRQRGYSAIHLLGLVLGISSCLVIYQVTRYDESFDRNHPNENRIYRIVGEAENEKGDKMFLNSVIPPVAGIENQIPGFKAKSGMIPYGADISIPEGNNPPKKFDNHIRGSYSSTAIITWPEYFSIFKYQWLQGNPQSLGEPFKVVLTENRAKLYFGNIPLQDMIGKTVIYQDSLKVSVAGIVKDWDFQSDLGYTDFISISTATHSFLKQNIPAPDWSSLQPHQSMAWVELEPGVSAANINAAFAEYIKKHVTLPTGTHVTLTLQPLSELHFTKEFRRGDDGDDFRKAYMPTLYILMGVAFFILLLAAINFINLSTAQAIQRAREIGIRKVLGSSKNKIAFAFLVETFLLVAIASLISLGMVNPLLDLFKDYIPEGVHFSSLAISNLGFLLGITLLTTLLAGFYPSRVLTSYKPVLTLKGPNFQVGKERISLRKVLIVFQFTLSLCFIIAALVIEKQVRFMQHADKGFSADGIITVSKWGDHHDKLKILASEVSHIAGVSQVIWQGNPPMGFAKESSTFVYKGRHEIQLNPIIEEGDDSYIPFYGMKLIAGRNMVHSDTLGELVINQTMARAMGFENPADAVGKLLYTPNSATPQAYPIVGVVADFHEGSLHDAIEPAVIANMVRFRYSIALKLAGSNRNPGQVKAILARVGTDFKKLFPDDSYRYQFMNESIGFLYGQEEKTLWLVSAAMCVAILISCMGVLGLGMFTARRKVKEIGIRKVLGASVSGIAVLLGREFVGLIVVSLLIASPVAYYFMNRWLQGYSYRTGFTWWIFLLAGSTAILVALITVSFQAVRAALANPVDSLRTE